jgi:hypothetical protein
MDEIKPEINTQETNISPLPIPPLPTEPLKNGTKRRRAFIFLIVMIAVLIVVAWFLKKSILYPNNTNLKLQTNPQQTSLNELTSPYSTSTPNNEGIIKPSGFPSDLFLIAQGVSSDGKTVTAVVAYNTDIEFTVLSSMFSGLLQHKKTWQIIPLNSQSISNQVSFEAKNSDYDANLLFTNNNNNNQAVDATSTTVTITVTSQVK